MPFQPNLVYTIGHGRHPFAYFLELLQANQIEFLCDVRSAPRSRWPQYNARVLAEALRQHSIGYEHLPECGGKVLAPASEFARGLDRIAELSADLRLVLMCSESHPLSQHAQPRANCHRVGLLSSPLKARGVEVIHILPDGRLLELNERDIPSIW